MVQEYKRYNEEWALLTLDIDHFKKFNDEFGHQLGDNVLKLVASTVKNCIRVSDRVFRYGGEEFGLILRETDLDGAIIMAERIRKEIGSLQLHNKAQLVPVTSSLL